MRFAGKTIIVTGAGSGIGLATARRLLAEGGFVALADVRAPSRPVAELIESEPRASFVTCDVTDQSDV